MATIPEIPQEQKIVPVSGAKRISVPTYNGGSVTPQATYTSSYIGGQQSINTVDNITNTINKVVDYTTVIDNQNQGYMEQQKAIAEGSAEYLSPGVSVTTAGQAYQKGAKVAYISNEIMGADSKIREFEEKSGYDAEKFVGQVNEYKKDWLGKFSSDLQLEMGEKYDNISRIRASGLMDRKVKFDISQHVEAQDNYDSYNLNNFRAAYSAGGAMNEGVEDALKELALGSQKRYETGQSIEKISASRNSVQQEIANIVALADFKALLDPKSPNYNPGATEEFINDYATGKNNLGELGDTFSQFFPGGNILSAKQRSGIVTVLKAYNEQLKTQTVAIREQTKKDLDSQNTSIENGEHYQLNSTSNNWEFKPTELAISDLELKRFTNQEIATQKLNHADASIVGGYAFQAKTINPANTSVILAELNNAQYATNQDVKMDPAIKTRKLAVIAKATKKVNEIIQSKRQALIDGKQSEWLIDNFKIPFDDTTAEGLNKFATLSSQVFNIPFSEVKLPKEGAQLTWADLHSSTTGDFLLGKLASNKGNLGDYHIAKLTRAAEVAPSGEKNMAYAVVGIAQIAEQDSGAARDLATAFVAKSGLTDAFKKKFPAENQTVYVNDAQKGWATQFGTAIDNTTSQGKIIYDTYMLKFYQAHAGFTGPDANTNKQAINEATEFVKKFYPTVTFDNGSSAVIPGNEIGANTVTAKGNDVLNNPARYGLILGTGETLDSWEGQKNQLRFVADNGQLVLRFGAGQKNLSRVFMRMPSGSQDIIGTDMKISIGDKYNGVTQDAEITASYDSDPAWYPKFIKERPLVKLKMTQDEFTGTDIMVEDPKKLNDYAIDIIEYANKTLPKFREGQLASDFSLPADSVVSKTMYQDRFAKTLIPPTNGTEYRAFNAISLALKDGNIDETMLAYMANKSSYLSKHLNTIEKRQTTIDFWKQNYQNMLKSKTANTTSTQMSVLQAFTVALVDLAPQYQQPAVPVGGA